MNFPLLSLLLRLLFPQRGCAERPVDEAERRFGTATLNWRLEQQAREAPERWM